MADFLKTLKQVAGQLIEGPSPSDNGGVGSFKMDDLPWSDQNSDAFFPRLDIDPARAGNLYPYRLVVIDVTDDNEVVGGDIDEVEVVSYKSDTGGIHWEITGELIDEWKITLPITPQQLNITDQFAINTSATMRGVVEEHNGVKFKMISASGTTGIWPTRDKFEDPRTVQRKDGDTGLATLFGGTLEALGGLASAARNFDSFAKKGSNPQPKSLDFTQDESGTRTGYFQALLVQQFLEQYAMAKKNPANKGWRLVFDCPKINESFVVTPIQYTASKSQRSPGESLYTMQFKAWKRIKIGSQGEPSKKGGDLQKITPDFFQRLTGSISRARSLMSAASNVIKAVRSDFRKPFDALRQVTLLAKDFAGIAVSAADLPNQIVKDAESSIKKSANDLSLATSLTSDRSRSAQKKMIQTISLIQKGEENNEGLSSEDIEAGNNGTAARDANRTSPLNNVFNEPESNFDFFDSLNVDSLSLNPKQRQKIQDEIELNSLLSIEEIKGFIKETQDLILDLTNNFGAGDEFFSEVYGRPAPRERATPMTLEEFELITALEEAVLNMNILVATRNFDEVRTESPLEYVGGLAQDSDIPFDSSYTSKYLAPVPFGLTIEQISARYLGDPDRYNEIITINSLRSPYIDEDGFSYSFLSNGDGRQFNIETKENLYIGQKITLSSNTEPVFTRKITAIEKITDTNYLITVDGVDNLSILTTSDNAQMRAFLPGTVNSQNQIYIPSNEAIEEQGKTYDIPYLKEDTLTGLSKIDWLLTDGGDVVLNSFGEISLANGLTNLIQALKMKVVTKKGDILSSPEFGLGLQPGINVTDITVENVLKDIRNMVLQDPRFEGVDKIEINLLPPDLSITISARLANGRGIFPINFTV
jgi:hypothetical protein